MTQFPAISTSPLMVKRQPFLENADCQRIHELARRILGEVGLEVRKEEHRRRLEAGGLVARGERVLFPDATVEAFVDEVVARNRKIEAEAAADVGEVTQEIRLWVSTYALYVHDLETGRLEPYTSERLVEMCKLVDSLAEEAVAGSVPGIPLDVRPEMQARRTSTRAGMPSAGRGAS